MRAASWRSSTSRASRADADDTWRSIVAAASGRYADVDGHAFRFARSKLRRDRVFRFLIEHGLFAPRSRVVDVGCGQGLLSSVLQAACDTARHGGWPAHWAAPPVGASIVGIDLRARDIERARASGHAAATFVQGDMRDVAFPACDAVVFIDTLHYIGFDEQHDVLRRACAALRPGGALLLRVGDLSAPLRHRYGVWVDRLTRLVYGGGFGRLHGRPLDSWTATLAGLGLDVQSHPMNGRAPFANRLLVARRTA